MDNPNFAWQHFTLAHVPASHFVAQLHERVIANAELASDVYTHVI